MSNNLNATFMRDPKQFLTTYLGIQSTNIQAFSASGRAITAYELDGDNVGQFDLQPGLRNCVDLKKYEGGLFAESAIKAYYLSAVTDKTKQIPLADKADYCFTDTITGCAFMAWGANRKNVNVLHSNALTLGKITYMKLALEIRQLNAPFTIIYTYQDYQSGVLQGENPSMVVNTVVGHRKGDGWHFYTRGYIGVGGGVRGAGIMQPRGLQAQAVEIDPEGAY
jgi:hypothetical protein